MACALDPSQGGGHRLRPVTYRFSPANLGHRLPRGLRSNTSTLIPDVSIFLVTPEDMTFVVVDAKRRSSAMRADDAAEAASKYVWGCGRDPGANEPRIDVEQVIITTTSGAPLMFSEHSRITTTSVTPATRSLLRGPLMMRWV